MHLFETVHMLRSNMWDLCEQIVHEYLHALPGGITTVITWRRAIASCVPIPGGMAEE